MIRSRIGEVRFPLSPPKTSKGLREERNIMHNGIGRAARIGNKHRGLPAQI